MNDKMKYAARWLFVGHAANAAKPNLQQTYQCSRSRSRSLSASVSVSLAVSFNPLKCLPECQ